MAQAGADITLVGRSPKSGEAALDKIRAKAKIQNEQRLEFVQGDLGSLASVNELVETLASSPEKYDFLVLTAMTFPDCGLHRVQPTWMDSTNPTLLESLVALSYTVTCIDFFVESIHEY